VTATGDRSLPPGPLRTAGRRQARERALELLYEADMKQVAPSTVVAALGAPPLHFTVDLVSGVEAHATEIDGLLRRLARTWALERMPALDRAVLRLATYELGWRPDVPTEAVIAEAVELAGAFSTDESARFVNGVLARAAEELGRPLGRAPAGSRPGR